MILHYVMNICGEQNFGLVRAMFKERFNPALDDMPATTQNVIKAAAHSLISLIIFRTHSRALKDSVDSAITYSV